MFDNYTLKARVYPIIILFFPIIILGLSYSYQFDSIILLLTSVGVVGALMYLFSQLGRDLGKKKEAGLWKHWGGPPTTQLLQLRDSQIDQFTKHRYHQKMQLLCPSVTAPDLIIEVNNPDEADEVYRSWTKYLITQTRDAEKYPLLLKENTNYGFRRNLWGLKQMAILIIVAMFIGNYLFWLVKTNSVNPFTYPDSFMYASISLLATLLFWAFLNTRKWVRIPAFSYAERLCEAIDTL